MNPGSGNIGINSLLVGYKLQSGSTALSSGKLISPNGGFDFYGNVVSSSAVPNRGAYQGLGVAPITAAPIASGQNFCALTFPTVANLIVNGTMLKWYANEIGGNELMTTTILSSATYYVSQTLNGTESTRTAVAVTVNSIVNPTFTQVNSICFEGSLAALPTTSNNSIAGSWSPAINSAATTLYTFTPSLGICASNATMTIVVNNSVAGIISGNQTITTGRTPTNIVLSNYTGSIQWQSSFDGVTFSNISGATNPILLGTTIGPLILNRYIRAVVTIGSCASVYSSVSTITITCCKYKFN